MSFKRYRIIFILIFVLSSRDSRGTFAAVNANDRETTKQHVTNDMENAQSGELFTFRLLYCNSFLMRLTLTSMACTSFSGKKNFDDTAECDQRVLSRLKLPFYSLFASPVNVRGKMPWLECDFHASPHANDFCAP